MTTENERVVCPGCGKKQSKLFFIPWGCAWCGFGKPESRVGE